MTPVTVTKEFTFDAAHMLTGHQGLCKNVHGHTYKVEVTVRKNNYEEKDTIRMGPAEDMVVDFSELKATANKLLFDKMDHSFIYNSKGGQAEREIAELLDSKGMRIYNMNCRPTAENMAKLFFNVLDNDPALSHIAIVRVKVYETPTSYAEVTE